MECLRRAISAAGPNLPRPKMLQVIEIAIKQHRRRTYEHKPRAKAAMRLTQTIGWTALEETSVYTMLALHCHPSEQARSEDVYTIRSYNT